MKMASACQNDNDDDNDDDVQWCTSHDIQDYEGIHSHLQFPFPLILPFAKGASAFVK
jgi:antirestriction protein